MTEDRSKQAGILTTAEFIRFGFKTIIGIALARILLPVELGSYRQLFLFFTFIAWYPSKHPLFSS